MYVSTIKPFALQNNFANNSETTFKSRFINGMKRPRHIKPFVASQSFARYNPLNMNFGTYSIPVHNEGIGQKLKQKYSISSFRELFNFSKAKGVFEYIMDNKTGFIKTSLINHKENPLMSDLIWITDSCHNMLLAKREHPEDCVKILEKLTDFYTGQQANFDYVIANPEKYKDNAFFPGKEQVGVGHCFVPKTHKPHHWFALTRLESIGNYLQTSTDMIIGGLSGKNYGYKSADEIPDKVINAISNCSKYLKAINYPEARSCGAWEEQTFVNSLTSDTSIINQGMRDIMALMYKETTNPEILKVRERILSSKHGDVFNNKEELAQLLKDGEYRVKAWPDFETFGDGYARKGLPKEEKCLERQFDSALSFMYQSETLYSDNPLKDSQTKLDLLDDLCKALVRPNGALRYQGDEYLNLDYHKLTNESAKKESKEAEWFLVSEISSAYGTIVKNLLSYIEEHGTDEKSIKLLKQAFEKQTEHINRSYARITPKNMTKSNGYSCPAYKVPEAYEAVTTSKGIKYVPGAHPLTWAESSLMKASEIFEENLRKIDELGLNI